MIDRFCSYILDKMKEYVIFDLGARDCLESIQFYKKFPNAKIYSFECNPNTLSICKKNIEPYQDRITLIEGAVCDYDGTVTFYPINQKETKTTWADGNPGASSLYKSNGNYTIERYVQDTIQVPCHRLDSIMVKYNIKNVDIIWMDLQGAELLALKGLGNFLNAVSYIHTEVSYKEIYTGQVMFSELHGFIASRGFMLKNTITLCGWQEDAIYEKCQAPEKIFDIVIPVGPNDKDIILKQIEYTKKNIIGYRNIYIVSPIPLVLDGCIYISEEIFPFSIETVSKYHGTNSRNGWYLQQLIKMYSGLLIPDIMDKYLVVDADTFFIKPTTFFKDGKALYNYHTPFHTPYFTHMELVHPSLKRMDNDKSGICHHMIFERRYLTELFNMVKNLHNKDFYVVFLEKVKDYNGSGASEYEIYFNYLLYFHPNDITLRLLKWKDSSTLSEMNDGYDYLSYHWYIRKS
jgi:FkbM family methyltransferase